MFGEVSGAYVISGVVVFVALVFNDIAVGLGAMDMMVLGMLLSFGSSELRK